LKADLDSSSTTGEQLRVNLEKERAVNEDVTSELEARQALVARLTGEVEAERDRRERDRTRLTEELDRARESQHLLDEGMVMIGRALNLEGQLDPVILADSAHTMRNALQERNRWVTLLLGEIQRRRLKPFPRPLTVGEKAFLENQGQVGKK
jgi:predicted  nucleic acid-binding Zn-ribbon protein